MARPQTDEVLETRDATPDRPIYSKFPQENPNNATQFWGITVHEGWRSWILCCDMYEWAADELLRRLRAAPAERWPGV